MNIKFFGRPGCPKCPPAKELAQKLSKENIKVELYDLGEADGLAEGTIYGVMSTPTIIVVDEKGKEIISWRGETPSEDEIKKHLK